MKKRNLSLKPSELAVFQAAATIYASYVATGKVDASNAQQYREQALGEAVELAIWTDQVIVSDGEFD